MRSKLRIFISSPADVQAAREVAAQTIERMAREYARFFILEPFLWENEPMVASGHFQDVIELPSNFEVVTLILWSRLGTLLPDKTAVREYRGIDGRTQLTGSEWEFETALASARSKGSPEILVYRSRESARVDCWDTARRQEQLEQLSALDRFWSRHFSNEDGILAAYSEFDSLEQFSRIFEAHVRQLVQNKIAAGGAGQRGQPEVLWTNSPFRGLEAYEFEHAPIYFGQDESIGKALSQLTASAKNGTSFLMLVGASGVGKSSLAKAGIVPRLLVPRRVSGAAFVRRLVFRPSDMAAGEDLFAALARRLASQTVDGEGFPELADSEQSVRELAAFLRESASARSYPFSLALGRLAPQLRREGRMLENETAKLVLVIDQLEELFTIDTISAEQRRRFIDLIADLARSGHVWIVATMRSDFWHRVSELPGLMALSEGHGRLDLLPPTTAKIGQMIRQPAEAAGISFEHPAEGEVHAGCRPGASLDEAILDEVEREPGVLPLLSYLLDQLYRLDILEAHGSTLTFASYERLHGLKGAIAARAEATLTAQPPEVRLALRRLLFLLVQISNTEGGDKQITARRAPLSLFPENSPVRRLVDVFLDPSARLVIAEGSASEPSLRVAHEALFREWGLARELVSAIAGELKTRKMIEERYERWKEISDTSGGRRGLPARWFPFPESGLLSDADLEDARRLLTVHRDDLLPSRVAYVDRSNLVARRKRNFAMQGLAALVGVLSVLTVTAIIAAARASHYSNMVNCSLRTMHLQHQVLLFAERSGDSFLLGKAGTDHLEAAVDLYRLEIAFGTIMHVLQPDNRYWQHDIASGNARMGYGLQAQGHVREALPLYEDALSIAEQLRAKEPKNPLWKRDEDSYRTAMNKAVNLLGTGAPTAASRQFPDANTIGCRS